MNELEQISVTSCPTCGALAQHIAGEPDTWRHVEAAAALSVREAVDDDPLVGYDGTICGWVRGDAYMVAAPDDDPQQKLDHGWGPVVKVRPSATYSLPTTPQPGDGVVVPREPTEDMLDALRSQDAYCENCKGYSFDARNGYAAMLAAAPSAKGVV